ncbi:MAG: hypothetical protein U0931_21025 [Vulcanimicrobiota bacterium]
MAVAQQYSYRYRVLWLDQPRLALAGDFGVGPDPLLKVKAGRLHLTARSGGWAYSELEFWLPDGLATYDTLDLESTPLNMHTSYTWKRSGQVQLHLGHLPNLSGSPVGSAMLEIVNEFDVDGRLALYQRDWSLRLSPGQQGRRGDHHFFLRDINGLVTGSSYRACGWLAHQRFSVKELEGWSRLI